MRSALPVSEGRSNVSSHKGEQSLDDGGIKGPEMPSSNIYDRRARVGLRRFVI